MGEVVIFIIAVLLAISPLGTGYAAYKHYKWWNFLKPSRTMFHLMVSSFASFISSIPLSFLALYRIVGGPYAPSLPGAALILGLIVLVLAGLSTYRMFAFRDLDHAIAMIEGSRATISDGDVIADTYKESGNGNR